MVAAVSSPRCVAASDSGLESCPPVERDLSACIALQAAKKPHVQLL